MIVKLEPYEIEMASQVANKRYVENIKMKELEKSKINLEDHFQKLTN